MVRPASRLGEQGFSLIEVIVSMAIAGIVLSSVTVFVFHGLAATWQQGRTQTGGQLALDGMETARTLRGIALVEGRAACTASCPTAAVAAVAAALVNTQRWDVASSPAVAPALPLPATPENKIVNGITMKRYWYVGRCWAPIGGGACVDTASHAPTVANPVPFYRVVVAVTWPSPSCGATTCSYVSSALFVGNPLDPVLRT